MIWPFHQLDCLSATNLNASTPHPLIPALTNSIKNYIFIDSANSTRIVQEDDAAQPGDDDRKCNPFLELSILWTTIRTFIFCPTFHDGRN